jgi:hypothetical protein
MRGSAQHAGPLAILRDGRLRHRTGMTRMMARVRNLQALPALIVETDRINQTRLHRRH